MTNSLFSVAGKMALITGSSRGLGFALAKGLSEAGANVVIHGRNQNALNEAAKELETTTGRTPLTVSFDVTDQKSADSVLRDFMNTHGIPDILINNAGVQKRAPFNEFPADDWDSVLSANLSSVFYVSKPITTKMAERGAGKVINIGSVMTQLGRETIVPYTASKGGVAMMSKGMAADLARHNIQVNTVSPGYFKTEMNKALVADKDFNTWVEKRTPAQRWGLPEELVGTVVYLSSDASAFVSGQNIFVDGGMTSVV